MWEIFLTRIDYVWAATISDVMAASAFAQPAGVDSNCPKTEPARAGKCGLKARMQIAMNHNIHKPYD